METVFLYYNNKCNKKCFYCFNNGTLINKRNHWNKNTDLTLEDKIRLVEELGSVNVKNIILTGGEPLLEEDIFEFISKCSEKKINTLLLTNGTLINQETVSKLYNSGLNSITLSLNDLVNTEGFNKKIKFYQEKLNIIISKFDDTTIISLLTKKNFLKTNKIFREFDTEKNNLLFQPIYLLEENEKYKDYSLFFLEEKDWKELQFQLSDWLIKHNSFNYFQLIKDYYLLKKISNVSCFMGSSAMVIDLWGNVFPCFYRKDLYIGNIKDESIKNLMIKNLVDSEKLINANCIGDYCIPLFVNYL